MELDSPSDGFGMDRGKSNAGVDGRFVVGRRLGADQSPNQIQ
jgi:hypothetical protein